MQNKWPPNISRLKACLPDSVLPAILRLWFLAVTLHMLGFGFLGKFSFDFSNNIFLSYQFAVCYIMYKIVVLCPQSLNKTGLQPVSRTCEQVHYFGGWVEGAKSLCALKSRTLNANTNNFKKKLCLCVIYKSREVMGL